MYTTLIAVALLGFASADVLKFEPSGQQQATARWPPSFCNGLSCPKYTLVNKTKGHEERKYDASRWVTTALTGVDFEMASYTMFMKLFQYIGGNNKAGKKIAMTCPVISRIIPGPGPACANNFTMSFYLDIDNPPQPNADDVYLSSLPQDLDVFVKEYSGFSSKTKFLKNAAELAEELDSLSLHYNTKYYYTAGYDSPFKFFNRHNEVWFVRE